MQMPLQVLERRVEQDRIEAAGCRQQILQVYGVVARGLGGREQRLQQRVAMRRHLVQRQRRAAGLGDHRHQAGAGGGLEHPVAGADLGCGDSHGGKRRGRGELVERHLLFAPPRVGEGERGQIGEQGHDLGRRVLQARKLRREPAKLQHEGGLDGVVGVTPDPCAFGVRAAERGGQGRGDQAPVERPGAIELRRQGAGGGQRVGGLVAGGDGAEERKRGVHIEVLIAGGGGRLPPVPRARRPLPSPSSSSPAPAGRGLGRTASPKLFTSRRRRETMARRRESVSEGGRLYGGRLQGRLQA